MPQRFTSTSTHLYKFGILRLFRTGFTLAAVRSLILALSNDFELHTVASFTHNLPPVSSHFGPKSPRFTVNRRSCINESADHITRLRDKKVPGSNRSCVGSQPRIIASFLVFLETEDQSDLGPKRLYTMPPTPLVCFLLLVFN
jgi:hypothetical protein